MPGRTQAPYGFVILPNRDMTRVSTLVGILRMQGIEVGQAGSEIKIGDDTFPAGSYVVKDDQPYGRLAGRCSRSRSSRRRTSPPTTTADGRRAWRPASTCGDRRQGDPGRQDVAGGPVDVKGTIAGSGAAGLAVAHYGSNNMIAFRYKLKTVPMRIAETTFTVDGKEFPAGSFVIAGPISPEVRAAVEEFGLTGAALSSTPTVPMHDADVPRIAIYSQWSGTQELGWYRFTLDKFGIPFDLIFKERVKQGNLKGDYDVILMAAQNIGRAQVHRSRTPRSRRRTSSRTSTSSSGCTARRRT